MVDESCVRGLECEDWFQPMIDVRGRSTSMRTHEWRKRLRRRGPARSRSVRSVPWPVRRDIQAFSSCRSCDGDRSAMGGGGWSWGDVRVMGRSDAVCYITSAAQRAHRDGLGSLVPGRASGHGTVIQPASWARWERLDPSACAGYQGLAGTLKLGPRSARSTKSQWCSVSCNTRPADAEQ